MEYPSDRERGGTAESMEESPVGDVYQAYVERRRARQPEEVVVTTVLTEREAKLLVELVELTSPQFKREQALVLLSAGSKVSLALTRARER